MELPSAYRMKDSRLIDLTHSLREALRFLLNPFLLDAAKYGGEKSCKWTRKNGGRRLSDGGSKMSY